MDYNILSLAKFVWGVLFLILLSAIQVRGQNKPIPPDTIIVKDEKERISFGEKWQEPYPNPVRAGVFSLVVPGAGQVYNRAWWKVPLVYGGLGAMGYFYYTFRDDYRSFDRAYELRLLGQEDEYVSVIRNAETLKRLRDTRYKWMQQSILGFVAVYVVQALEAYVHAHLKDFDLDEDLSIHIQHRPARTAGGSGLEVGIIRKL